MKTIKGKLVALLLVIVSVFTLAACKPKTYTLSFVTNREGVTVEPLTVKKEEEINLGDSKYQLNSEGYVFKGWFFDAQLTRMALVFNLEEDTTVYAKWARINTITFDSNGGSTVEAKKVETGNTTDAPIAPTKEGYVFVGWYKEAELTNLFNFDTTEINADMVLYAKWNEIYTVTYHSNGGSTIEPTKVEVGKTYTLPSNPTREGYRFNGWYKDEELTEEFSNTGNITSNLDLYAKWTANSYTVIFNANGGRGNMAQQSFAYGTAKALSTNTFTKTGYVFKGWALSETGEKAYDNEEEVSTLITSGSITLYAVWEKDTLSLVYETNYPEDVEEAESVASVEIKIGDTKALYKALGEIDHYTFAKWTLDKENPTDENSFNALADFQLTEALIASHAHNGEIKLYALWTPKVYTVLFIGGEGATGQMASQSFTYNVSKALSLNTFEKEGFSFVGWKDQENNTYTDGQSIKLSGNLILVAQWHDKVYKVTFNPGTGTGEMAVQNIVVDEDTLKASGKLNDNQFTKVGHLFAGWATEENGEKVYDDKADVVLEDHITLYALWVKASYTVRFNANGGQGEMSDLVGDFGATSNLTKNAFTKVHYEFVGWALTINGEKALDDEEEVTLDAQNIQLFNDDRVLVLYAVWKASEYTVTFNANGGQGEMQNETFTYGVYKSLDTNLYTRNGYEFMGWSTSSNGEVLYTDGAEESFEENIELFAVWKMVVTQVIVVYTNGYTADLDNPVQEYLVQDTTNLRQDDNHVGENVSELILGDSYSHNDLTFKGAFTDLSATQELTASSVYTAQEGHDTVYVYLYFTLELTIDNEALNTENVVVDVYKEEAIKGSYNLYKYLPLLSLQSGKIVLYDTDDLRDVTKSLTVTVVVVNEDAENVYQDVNNSNTYYVHLNNGTKVINVTKFYQGIVTSTYRSVEVLLNSENCEYDATDPTNIIVTAKQSTYSIADIEGQSSAHRIYQIYTIPTVSGLSAPNYQEYADKDLGAQGSRWINTVKEGYHVGSSNTFKLRLNVKDADGNLLSNIEGAELQYLIKLNNTPLTETSSTTIQVGSKQYNGLVYSDGTKEYMYILSVDDTDKRYLAVQFTEDAIWDGTIEHPMNFEFKISTKDGEESITLEFTVNAGVNVETNAELKVAYADLDVTEINIHRTIVAQLEANQYRNYGNKQYVINYEPGNQLYHAQRGEATGDVYVRAVTDANTIENHLKINGNYFTIDGSGLDIIDDVNPENGYRLFPEDHDAVNANHPWGGAGGENLWIKNVQTSIFANLLAYRDTTVYSDENNPYKYQRTDGEGVIAERGAYDLVYRQASNSVTYNNLYIIGNTITPQVNYSQAADKIKTEEELAAYNSGGYNGILNRGCSAYTNNVVIDYTNIGLNASCDKALIHCKDTYVFYSWGNSLYGWSSCDVKLENCEFRYSGGACIHIDEHREERGSYEVYDCMDGYRQGQENERIITIDYDPKLSVDRYTQLINWVTGAEVWFKLNGLAGNVTSLVAGMNGIIQGYSYAQYSIVKSYNNLSEGDIAYSQDVTSGSQMWNFAVMMREARNEGDNIFTTAETTGKYAQIELDINGVKILRQPVQKDVSTWKSFAANSLLQDITPGMGLNGFMYNTASQNPGLMIFPVSSISNYVDSLVPIQGGNVEAQVALLLGIYQAYMAEEFASNRAAIVNQMYKMMTGNPDASIPADQQLFNQWSAYAMGLSQNGILDREDNPTGYNYAEISMDINLGGAVMRGIILTYYYEGNLSN